MQTTLKTDELAGSNLLAAVQQAIAASYTKLSFELGAMNLTQLQAYLEAHPEVDLGHGFDDNVDDIRAAALARHEHLPGADDLREACEADLWPLCERILENHGYSLGRRVRASDRAVIWRVEPESEMFAVYGDTPREGILRCYVMANIGAEVTLES